MLAVSKPSDRKEPQGCWHGRKTWKHRRFDPRPCCPRRNRTLEPPTPWREPQASSTR
jgi:hypothetical protein